MAHRTIPLRELRNDVSAILRAVESEGATFTITVRGKPVARLSPATEAPGPRRFVPAEDVRRAFADIPVDPTWLPELLAQRADADEDDTWPEYKDLP
jgi:prevent-host-death family protein